MDKKKIHFILPGGGVRGSFQAGFLYQLYTNYSNLYSTYHVDGVSIGSINGLAFSAHKLKELKDFWMSLNDISDISSPFISVPIISKLYQMYNTVFGQGICSLQKLHQKINELEIPKYNSTERKNLSNYHCSVVDINTGKLKYIDGSQELIKPFVCASCSLWIITEPKKIGHKYYIDGGLLEHIPTKCIKHSKADLIVIVGFEKKYIKEIKNTDDISNMLMLEYLDRLIDISRLKITNNLIKKCEKYNVIKIPNTLKNISTMNINKDIIIKGFNDGILAADKFVNRYLKL